MLMKKCFTEVRFAESGQRASGIITFQRCCSTQSKAQMTTETQNEGTLEGHPK